jgi:hypothetical protein
MYANREINSIILFKINHLVLLNGKTIIKITIFYKNYNNKQQQYYKSKQK